MLVCLSPAEHRSCVHMYDVQNKLHAEVSRFCMAEHSNREGRPPGSSSCIPCGLRCPALMLLFQLLNNLLKRGPHCLCPPGKPSRLSRQVEVESRVTLHCRRRAAYVCTGHKALVPQTHALQQACFCFDCQHRYWSAARATCHLSHRPTCTASVQILQQVLRERASQKEMACRCYISCAWLNRAQCMRQLHTPTF